MARSKKATIRNLFPRSELGRFSRKQRSDNDYQTVKFDAVEEMEAKGWQIQRKNKASVRMFRRKPKSALLEARVWRVMFKMGFPIVSGPGGATVELDGEDAEGPTQQIDVVAIDDEAALAIECKSYESLSKDSRLAEKLAKHAAVRRPFADAVHRAYPHRLRRHVATVMVVWDLVVRDTDRKRAAQSDVLLLDEDELIYYEALVDHLGPAARYQLLCDAFRQRTIKGLKIVVPALRTKVGSLSCYTFSVRPDYLLKVAYVAHRAKGKTIDLDAYQRMISKTRLKQIREFIDDDGVFPTNIVINLEDTRHLRFDLGKQEGLTVAGGQLGQLTLSPSYGSAWIIDGQHRLFAFSGHDRASSSYLNVLAFDGLSPPEQTKLFVDINSEQRKVSRSLLWELDAILKWEAPEEDKRVHAIISQAGMTLGEQKDSPLHGRMLLADGRRTKTRCVSLTAVATALSKPGFFFAKRQPGFTQYGPLWRDEPKDALRRTVTVLIAWLGAIAEEAEAWWDLGADEGGGLAMNDGVTVCINMLRSVVEYLDGSGSLGTLSDDDLADRVTPYAVALGRYFARMTDDERRHFRQLRGGQGHDTGTRQCQEALHAEFEKYRPDGLEDWIERRKANTNEKARRIIDEMERAIQARIIEVLRDEYDLDGDQWWYDGVPENVRTKVRERVEKAGGGEVEEYFDLVHYEAIIRFRWTLLKDTFAYGPANVGKEKGTSWLREIAGWRNTVMHPSRRDFLGLEELSVLEGYRDWLSDRLSPTPTT